MLSYGMVAPVLSVAVFPRDILLPIVLILTRFFKMGLKIRNERRKREDRGLLWENS